jgi:tripartite ATP-independent transporter DctP family solute receptor
MGYRAIFPLLVLSVLLPAGSASAEAEFVIRYSHLGVVNPMVQSSSAKAVVFKAELEKLSGGRIKVEVFPGGGLGGQVSSVQQIRKGTIHIADISSGVLASLYYEPLEIFDLPFVFSSRTTARMVLDNENAFTRKLIEDCADKTGIRILSLGPFGFRHMTNNVRAIRTPDDMRGLKMRTMEIGAHMELMRSVGSTPAPVPWLELYTSLQTKVVDGEETTLQNIVMGNLYQVQEHLSLTGHLMGVGAFLCNDKWYQSLPDDLRIAVVEAEAVARLTYDGFGQLLDTIALEKLKSDDCDIKVHSLTEQERQKFKDAALPHVRKWMEEKHGKKFVAEFFAAVEAAEKQLEDQAEATKTEGK